ncbi:MAG TPA: sigma-70 family RNA polymerase sigma factor [Puia sp.]|nr:sigma-70 family RNA polymerase sigma factor [Puia sp.]
MNSSEINIDQSSWTGLLNGDKDALYQLYTNYYHTLLFIGLKHTPDAGLVKDVIQQQFLYFWEMRSSLRVARNVRSYIIISFLRRLTNDWVKARKTVRLEVAWSKKEEEDFFETSPEEKLIERNNTELVSKNLAGLINALPARQRELIILKFYEGMGYEDIARKTGLTRRTIYNKIHEALAKIKNEALQIPARSGIRSNFLLIAALISFFFRK